MTASLREALITSQVLRTRYTRRTAIGLVFDMIIALAVADHYLSGLKDRGMYRV
jgi:hypothetical protein